VPIIIQIEGAQPAAKAAKMGNPAITASQSSFFQKESVFGAEGAAAGFGESDMSG
jgi:hypothetical protein